MLAFNVLTAYSDISSVSNGNVIAESAAIVDAKSGRRVIDLFTTLGTYTCCVSTFDSMFLKTAHFSSFEVLVSSKDHKELNTVSGSDVAPGVIPKLLDKIVIAVKFRVVVFEYTKFGSNDA